MLPQRCQPALYLTSRHQFEFIETLKIRASFAHVTAPARAPEGMATRTRTVTGTTRHHLLEMSADLLALSLAGNQYALRTAPDLLRITPPHRRRGNRFGFGLSAPQPRPKTQSAWVSHEPMLDPHSEQLVQGHTCGSYKLRGRYALYCSEDIASRRFVQGTLEICALE